MTDTKATQVGNYHVVMRPTGAWAVTTLMGYPVSLHSSKNQAIVAAAKINDVLDVKYRPRLSR